MEKYDVLIANSENIIGHPLAKKLEQRKYTVLCCRDSSEALRLCETQGGFSLVVLYSYNNDGSVKDTIKQFKKICPDIKVIVCSFEKSSDNHSELFAAGAERCVVMPFSDEKLAIIIKYTLKDCNYRNILTMVPEFLELNGFQANLIGFDYLTYAVQLCLKSPKKLCSLVWGLYPEIAEHFGSNWTSVERSMRNLGKKAEISGAFRNITNGRFTDRPTNYEMICGSCDAFSVYYGLHGNERKTRWRIM